MGLAVLEEGEGEKGAQTTDLQLYTGSGDTLAQALRQGRRHVIGVVVPRLHLAIFSEILQGIEREAGQLGYSTLICFTEDDPKAEKDCLNRLRGGFADGIIIAGTGRNGRMLRDIQASGIPLVQLPCSGVVDRFVTSRYELEHWLKGKNPLCDYLCENTVQEAESYAAGKPWTRVIWDVTTIAWLLNEDNRFMRDMLIPSPIPEYDKHYGTDPRRHFIRYVYWINRDALFEDLFRKLSEKP